MGFDSAMDGDHEPDVFATCSPQDFSFSEPRAVWTQPCWIKVYNSFRGVTDSAKARFLLPLAFDFKVDAFGRKPPDEQLSQQFWRLYEHAEKVSDGRWSDFLLGRRDKYHAALQDTSVLFKSPFRYVPRSEFETTTLDVVLAQDPETMVIYVPEDTDSDGGAIYTLRIHSSLWHRYSDQRYRWYQKTLPWRLQPEDVLPWFHATVARLPKKRQPRDLTVWDEKLVSAEPDLALPKAEEGAIWTDRPKLVLVFGQRSDVGYAALYHLERNRIQNLTRRGSAVTLRASIHNRYQTDPEKLWWTFHLLAPSTFHAQRLEGRLLSGEQIHFGIGDDITGMIACHGNTIDAIDVDPETLKRFCSRDGMRLALISPPRLKHKSYVYFPADQPLPEEFGSAT